MTEFEDFISGYTPEVRSLAAETRSFVLRVIPGIQEIVDPPSKIVAYGFGSKYADLICAIQPYKSHVNLIFSRGASLPDPQHLLEGTGKKARHIKIKAASDLEQPWVVEILAQAASIYRSG